MIELENAYYRAALATLKYLDDHGARRLFGPDADARWLMFTGEPAVLTEQDRIDLVLRDADVQWPGAFAARVVFDIQGIERDDSFGPSWVGCAPAGLWSVMTGCTFTLEELVGYILRVWGHSTDHAPAAVTDTLRSPAEVAAALLDYKRRASPFWSRDITVVAGVDTPQALCTRQLGALAGAIMRQPTRVIRSVA